MEIGGYLQLEEAEGMHYYDNLVKVNNARSGLLYILKAKKIKKLYIPEYLCASVSLMLEREKINFEFYKVDKSFMPVFDKELNKDEFIYIVNYFGQITNYFISSLKEKYKNIIVDNVQAFFQQPVNGIDTVYSCRKFFGVPDGGYVYCTKEADFALERDVSFERMKHVLGRYEKSASEFYEDFKKNDESFKEEPLRAMSKLTNNLLKTINYEAVKEKREKNFKILKKAFDGINKLEIKSVEGPYAYPLYLENGPEIKKELAKKKIFVPTLWPNVLEGENLLEKDFAENILPLPVDQRYGKEEMKTIIDEINKLRR